ncbi:MAG: NAD-dependent epimerase/dehydratase family protein [Bacillota bacterium]|nr:NAD-dependent epimerase/dehydratase family protein [Bacillota bacterium]
MTRALVLGGTRFFGVHLVNALLNSGMEVTIATRGNSPDSFGDRVSRITVDRTDFERFKESFRDTQWDVVYDQICYTGTDAMEAIEVFGGSTKRYVMTSTLSVYDLPERAIVEEDFDPFSYEIKQTERNTVNYQEGKRQAEAVFFQRAPFEVAAVRIPIVLGENDYTGRLMFHVDRILKQKDIYFSNVDSSFGFISEEEAGQFIAWIGLTNYCGPVNACSDGTVTLNEMLSIIEGSTGQKVILAQEKNEENVSPYNVPQSWYMRNDKAKSLGYTFSPLSEWLPKLVDMLAVRS